MQGSGNHLDDRVKRNIKSQDVMIIIVDKEFFGSGEKLEQVLYTKKLKKPVILMMNEPVSDDVIASWLDGCRVIGRIKTNDDLETVISKKKSIFII
jgi:hypothetical protein